MKNMAEQEKNQRVVTFLNRQEVDFLDKLGKDALFSTGLKLSRAKLIAWLVDFLQELNLNGEGIKSERDFENRVKDILGQNLNPAPACRSRVKGSVPTSPVRYLKFPSRSKNI